MIASSTKRGASATASPSGASEEPIAADGEFQIVQDGERGWPSKHAPVLLEYRSYWRGERTKYANQFFGLHIDGDGSVWKFHYPSALAPLCEYRETTDAAAREACFYQDSTLVARCSSQLLAELKRSILELPERSLELQDHDDHDGILMLGITGTRDGRPVTVGVCGSALPAQLQSPEARVIVDVFRRARRAARLPAPCSAGEHRDPPSELAPGVPSWTAR